MDTTQMKDIENPGRPPQEWSALHLRGGVGNTWEEGGVEEGMSDLPKRKTYRADIDRLRPEWEPAPAPGDYDAGIMPPLEEREEASEEASNLISSELATLCRPDCAELCPGCGLAGSGAVWHSPVLDIDFPARLIPSTTPGHFHLYLDGLILDWTTYRRLLDALAQAGVIQEGYANASIERKATYVRKPGIKKGDGLPVIQPVRTGERLSAPSWDGASTLDLGPEFVVLEG